MIKINNSCSRKLSPLVLRASVFLQWCIVQWYILCCIKTCKKMFFRLKILSKFLGILFFMLALLMESIILIAFYDLYFNQHSYISYIYKLVKMPTLIIKLDLFITHHPAPSTIQKGSLGNLQSDLYIAYISYCFYFTAALDYKRAELN